MNSLVWLRLGKDGKTVMLVNQDKIKKITVYRNEGTLEVEEDKSVIWYTDGTYDVVDISLDELFKAMAINSTSATYPCA